mgnify:FL=1
MSVKHRTAQGAALALALLWSASAQAADPKGIWLDHTGRGAVQIKDCKKGRGLCGFVVYIKQKKYADRCGLQILGNVTTGGGGWIYSPSRGSRYTVRLKRLSNTRLRVVGNASSSFFSKTFTWKKAPADLRLCGKYGAAQRFAAAKEKKADAPKKQFVNQLNSSNPVVPLSKELDDDFDRSTRVTGAEKPASKPPQSEIEEMEASLTSKQDAPAENANNSDVVIDVEEDEAEAGSVKTSGDPMEGKFKAVLGKFLGKGGLKGKCKFRIPYVNKVIRVPCK